MPERKEVCFLGIKMQDICIYMASVLANLHYRILVVDRSDRRELKYCIPAPDEGMEVVTYKNVDYLLGTAKAGSAEDGLAEKEEGHGEYDFVFHYYGGRFHADATCKEMVVVTDTDQTSIAECRALIGKAQVPVNLVVRNVCENKVNRPFFREMFAGCSCFLVEQFLLALDLMDEEYRICMQYEPCHDFKYISQDMKHLLIRMIAGMTDRDTVDIRRAYESARKGRVI